MWERQFAEIDFPSQNAAELVELNDLAWRLSKYAPAFTSRLLGYAFRSKTVKLVVPRRF